MRDTPILVSRQSVLLVTGVGVGLLTLSYVLGVQVGKQSAALRRPAVQGVDEELKALPEPLLDQLKAFDGTGETKVDALPPAAAPEAKSEPKPEVKPEAKAETAKVEPKAAPKPDAKAAPKDDGTRWNLQLVATPDPKEAERVAARAKAAGLAVTTVKDKKFLKVRAVKPLNRSDAEAMAAKLKEKGLKPFLLKAE